MAQVSFRFQGALNDFLPAEQRQAEIAYDLNGPLAVKHPIEALGVPHPEVELIVVNGHPVEFTYQLKPGDHVEVFADAAETEVAERITLRPPLPAPPGFVLDNHLGRLATYLRLLGFDTLYPDDSEDARLAEIAHAEGRVLLTRDRRLLMRKLVVYGYFLRSKEPREQIVAVLDKFRLHEAIRAWHRCLRCNGRLRPVPKDEVFDRLEPKTKKYYHEFHICRSCEQIYWKGSHFEPLRQLVEEIKRRG